MLLIAKKAHVILHSVTNLIQPGGKAADSGIILVSLKHDLSTSKATYVLLQVQEQSCTLC